MKSPSRMAPNRYYVRFVDDREIVVDTYSHLASTRALVAEFFGTRIKTFAMVAKDNIAHCFNGTKLDCSTLPYYQLTSAFIEEWIRMQGEGYWYGKYAGDAEVGGLLSERLKHSNIV